nr:MAG TPA: hypothetical protein [Bacteriophage sp.]
MTVHTAANKTRVKKSSANHLVVCGVVVIFALSIKMPPGRHDNFKLGLLDKIATPLRCGYFV